MTARRVHLAGKNTLPVPGALAEAIARRRLRSRIEAAVSRLIDALDALDPDPEAEPWLGAPELPATCRAVMFLPGEGWTHTPTLEWARGANDDREDEDEHGGDVLDEGEHDLGWAANVGQVRLGANTADGDETAPERHGGGFMRGAPDDYEDDGREAIFSP